LTTPKPIRIPLPCPKCGRDEVHLSTESASVVTLRCDVCAHAWSMETTALPAQVRDRLRNERGSA